MNRLINQARRYPPVFDGLLAVVLAVIMKLSARVIEWSALLDKDSFALVLGVVMALQFLGYAGLVYSVHQPKLVRLRNSAQFQNILLLMLAYMVVSTSIYFAQKLHIHLGLLSLAVGLVATARLVWIFVKTIKLL